MLLADELLQNGITKPQSTKWIAVDFLKILATLILVIFDL